MKRLNQKGFTLVELIVALIVAAVLTGSVLLIYTNQVYLSETARDLALANAYAEGKTEAIRSAGYLTLTDGTTNITSELPSELNQPRNASITISTPSSGIKQVQIVITYSSQGEPKTETYTTYIGELGIAQ
jgi:prepilin-type N-terminal cleavage/methylation domain-containing protein